MIPPPGRFKHHRSQDRLSYCAAFSNLGVGVSKEIVTAHRVHGVCPARLAAFFSEERGCAALLDGECGDGTGLIERHGRKSERPPNRPSGGRENPLTGHTDAQASATPAAPEVTAEVLKRSADQMTWCERCAVGIHFYCAQDHALAHGDDCNGYYRREDVATKSGRPLLRLLVYLQALHGRK